MVPSSVNFIRLPKTASRSTTGINSEAAENVSSARRVTAGLKMHRRLMICKSKPATGVSRGGRKHSEGGASQRRDRIVELVGQGLESPRSHRSSAGALVH